MTFNKLTLILTTVGAFGLSLSGISYAATNAELAQSAAVDARSHVTFDGSSLTFTTGTAHQASSISDNALGTVTITNNNPLGSKVYVFSTNGGQLHSSNHYDADKHSTVILYKMTAPALEVGTGQGAATQAIPSTIFNNAAPITGTSLNTSTNQILYDIPTHHVAHNDTAILTFSLGDNENMDHHVNDTFGDTITVHIANNS